MTHSRLSIERLEERCVPATWGNPWPDATHLTLSFSPDGTAGGGQSSNLFATLDAVAPRAVWQREILRAFQSWAQHAAVNIGVVSDCGQALGTTGRAQGDARFGDIRLAGGHFGDSVLAFSSPFDPLAGTWSGDIRINTSARWSIGGAGGVDLYTAVLQEAGHVFGLNNSPDSTSAMFEEYRGARTGVSSTDIARLQAIYGARPHDIHEGAAGNGTLATATRLGVLKDMGGVLALAVEGDLTTTSDRDVYSFNAPSLTGGLVFRLERDGLSLVTPRVTVFDTNGRAVGSTVSTNPTGGDLELRLTGVTPLGRYFIAVEGAGADDFRVGSYKLSVQNLPVVNSLLGAVVGTVEAVTAGLLNNDLHTNDSFLTAQGLLPALSATPSSFDHAYRASISDRWDVDFYKVTAPASLAGDRTLTVMAWGVGTSQLVPKVTVYNAAQQVVPVEVLVSEGGNVTVQAGGVTAGAAYYVKVEAASAGAATGNYFVGIDFGTTATRLSTFADSQVTATQPVASGLLQVNATAMFHFVLSTELGTGTGVELTITDRSGRVIRTVRAAAGESTSLTLTLEPGEYEFRFAAYRTDGLALTPARFKLKGARVTDPIGPQPEDTTSSPSQSSPPPSSTSNDSYWYGWSPPPSSGGTSYESGGSGGYRA